MRAAHPAGAPLSQLDAGLLSAASAGNLELLEAALEAGRNANISDFCGDSPLLLAARGGAAACCRALLRAGADARQQGSRGETAVMVAVQLGCSQLLEAVLTPGVDLLARSDGGLTALQMACLRRRPDALARLLRHLHAQLDAAVAAGAGGNTFGDYTAMSSQPGPEDAAVVAQSNNAHCQHQQAAATAAVAGRQLVLAMYAAVAAGEPRCLQLLVADPLAASAYAAQFAAPLPQQQGQGQRSAVEEERQQEELSFLLDTDAVGAHNSRAARFLWQTGEPGRRFVAAGSCAFYRCSFTVALRADTQCSPLPAPFSCCAGGLPCHLAAATNRSDCLQVLLSSGIGSPDECTAEGFTPLMLAATADAAAAAALLVKAGTALEACNHASRTALFLAAVSGSPDTLGLLMAAGADVSASEHHLLAGACCH
jgi:ankyrin repeat protein